MSSDREPSERDATLEIQRSVIRPSWTSWMSNLWKRPLVTQEYERQGQSFQDREPGATVTSQGVLVVDHPMRARELGVFDKTQYTRRPIIVNSLYLQKVGGIGLEKQPESQRDAE